MVKPLHDVFDAVGSVKTCTVKSCVGDVYHTLVEVGDYPGYFLPGFTPVSDDSADLKSCDNETLLMSFDHVAIAVEMNQSVATIEWYEKCFGMKRFLINKEEDRDNGLVLDTNNVGLRLRAMEYWKCAEVGLKSKPGMLAPPPLYRGENQIMSWMRQHGGPGIQHIAIYSADIKGDVKKLKFLGAEFAKPPPDSYYTEIGRLHDILRSGEDLEPLREHGILIDTEADGIHELTQAADEEKRESYLLQIFTKPIFKADPFFLELIQREGATGFGSGNIAALYRSVQAYIVG
ncbi:unnamed protein product [Lymnaea stagnalis]|uniref:VOC domain-containing protein n=1 Tax=Lymnaea stagnalis TaxID=6523 RepID=A0AAV2HX79_LYMST